MRKFLSLLMSYFILFLPMGYLLAFPVSAICGIYSEEGIMILSFVIAGLLWINMIF